MPKQEPEEIAFLLCHDKKNGAQQDLVHRTLLELFISQHLPNFWIIKFYKNKRWIENSGEIGPMSTIVPIAPLTKPVSV